MRKNVLRRSLILAGAAATALSLASCGTEQGNTTEGVMVVGMECAYNPFNWTEAVSNQYTVSISNQTGAYADGYDIQMAKKIADGLGLKLEVKAINWDGLIPALTTGDIDMIIAGMSNTAERRETIDFTDGYYTSEEVLLVKADGAYANATKLHDFANAKIAGQLGTLYADFANQANELVGAQVNATWNLSTVGEIMNEISTGIVDAQVVELPVAQGLVAANSNFKIVRLDSSDTFDANPEDVEVCIGVRKGYTYTAQINSVLSGISKSERDQMMAAAVSRAGSEE